MKSKKYGRDLIFESINWLVTSLAFETSGVGCQPSVSPHSARRYFTMEASPEPEENDNAVEEFDRNLPTTHSYLPGGLTSTRGWSMLEPGAVKNIPCWCHGSVVFPGESVPMHCPNLSLYHVGIKFIQKEKHFGLIFVNLKKYYHFYGVLCRVTEATEPFEGENDSRSQISFKAQAIQRFLLLHNQNWPFLLERNVFLNSCNVKILPDIVVEDPLKDCQLFSAIRQNSSERTLKKLRNMDAMLTPWPYFVYDIFDTKRIIKYMKDYFRDLDFENLPEGTIALSFWVASNLAISMNTRMELFVVDNAVHRLYMELRHLSKNVSLCCSGCTSQICVMNEVFAMSNEGINTNYCNNGGFMHNIVTVKSATNILLQGGPSLEFTWFPGYYWTIAVCSVCFSHVGWKFTAEKKTLRPQMFWGLTRNSTTPVEGF